MADLIVLAFDSEEGAGALRDRLLKRQEQRLIPLADAAVVVRHQDGTVKVRQLHNLVGAGALGGAFWGFLIGLVFMAPWLGVAAGAAAGAVHHKFSDIGVDRGFIKKVSETIAPGHSALFLLITGAIEGELAGVLETADAQVLQTSLSQEDEAKLRQLFGPDEMEG
jgi:uncharacterized membrane protein